MTPQESPFFTVHRPEKPLYFPVPCLSVRCPSHHHRQSFCPRSSLCLSILLLQTPHPEQLGPTLGSSEMLDLVSAKDLAGQLTDHDWNLFNRIHQVQEVEQEEEGVGGTPGLAC